MIYIFTQGGVIAVEGGAAAAAALGQVGRQLADDLAGIASQVDDANSLLDLTKGVLSNNGLDATKAIGAVAFSGLVTAGLMIGAVPVAGSAAVVIGAGWLAGELYKWAFDSAVGIGQRAGAAAYDLWGEGIDDDVNSPFNAARNWSPPRDPLVLDLDGDGIEATAISSAQPVLFDHDADAVRTGTGWIAADDGLLTLDLNGNGTIDSGRELFGDNTLLADGTTASNGFHAIAQHDGNGDGRIDDADAVYGQLRVWQDANQDGVSQSGELKTLSELGIASINVVGQASNINLGNGNTQPWSGSFTRSDGTTGSSGTPELSGSLLLASNNFYRDFTDDPELTTASLALPQMGGSGWVRDLREAMSLGTGEAQALEASVAGYASATTRDAQLALVDGLVSDWAATTGRLVTSTHRYSLVLSGGALVTANAGTGSYNGIVFTIRLQGEGMEQTVGIVGGTQIVPTAAGMEVLRRLNVLEVFNGTKFFNIVPPPPQDVGVGSGSGGSGGSGGTGGVIAAPQMVGTLSAAQIALINQSYEALREGAYEGLVLSTRLRTYLDAIEVSFSEGGVQIDTSQLVAALEAKKIADERNALIDLVELHKFAQPTLLSVGLGDMSRLRGWIDGLATDSPLRAELVALGVVRPQDGTSATQLSNLYLGDGSANNFNASGGNDVVDGGAGNDTLFGGAGSDVIDGGAGNDLLVGGTDSGPWNGSNYFNGTGNDTYLFGKGYGQDVVWDVDGATGNLDIVRLKEGVAPAEVRLTRTGNGNNLVLSISGTTDTLTIGNFFAGDGLGGFAIEQIAFADGTTWDLETIKARSLEATESADDLTAYASADSITGAGGNDRIWARAGDDVVDAGTGNDQVWGEDGNDGVAGGEGNDSLYGQNGNDTLSGDAGVDTLMGGLGNDLIDGGSGNDLLLGADDSGSWNGSNYYRGQGNDTYLFGKGDGQDTIWDVDTTTGNIDTISLKEGVLPSEVRLTRPGNGDHLVLSIAGTTDTLTVGNYFSGDATAGFAIEQIVFADGTTWDVEAIKARALLSSEGADDITGFASNDAIAGAGGNDRIWGRGGNDVIDGGTGNDQLMGEDGDDELRAGDGNDSVYGQNGNDLLSGGTGADTLMGGLGNDTIDSGTGNDLMLGADDSGSWNGSNYYRGQGNDTYLFGKGDGQDTIWDVDTTVGNFDTISLKEGVVPSEVRLTRPGNGDHLVLSIAGTTDTLTVGNYFSGDATGGFAIEQIVFADGTTWDVEAIKARALLSSEGADDITGFASNDAITGAGGNDRIWGRGGNDVIDGGAGNDQLMGEDGDDDLRAGDGNDSLYGQNGNDLLSGGTGADTLMGGLGNDTIDSGSGNDLMLGADDSGSWNGSNYFRGQGNDTYLFGKGDGQDTIWDVDTTTGNIDTISLKEGVVPSEVRLTRPGNGDHLVLSIAGTTDTLTIGNYFSGDATAGFAIEQIVFADGTTWDVEAIKARALLSSEAADDITGFASNDAINGAGGNDRIWGRGGNDVIDGGTGNDQLMGEDGDDDLRAGDGNDSVYGQNGNDLLSGGTGADTLMGGLGNDTIDSGSGNDLMLGADDSGSWNGSNYFRGQGNDTYLFGKGDGQDTIWDVDTTTGNIDTISLKEGVTPAEVRLTRPGNGDHLVLSIAGTTDSLTVGNYFSGDATGGFAIEQIVFADGTTWDVEAIKARALLSSEAADDITGFASVDVINGAGGNDRIWGRGGNDVIDGGAGNDQLMGEDGDDDLRAGDGNDSVYGQNGNDLLSGGTGADTLMGGLGNDTIDSGAGNDLMLGADDSGSWNGSNYFRGQGNDTYLFGKGDGQDTIWDVDTTTGNIDTISLKEGVLPSEVRLTRPGNGDHLVLSIAGTTDTLTVGNYFSGDATAGFAIEQIVFADGTTWNVDAIKTRVLLSSEVADDITGFASADVINGAGGDDRVWGRAGNDVIDGGTGNDQLRGEDGDDDLKGADGNDALYGENGNDTLAGGAGIDTLMGGLGNDVIDSGAGNDLLLGADDSGSWNGSNYYRGQGNDTFLFGKGDGQDNVWDYDTTVGNMDTIRLKDGVLPSEVRLSRPGNGNNLLLAIAGTTDTLTVGNFFVGDGGGGFAIEQIVFADGTTWNLDTIKAKAATASATENADDITGYAYDDVIDGAGGNDRIWGRAGNDILIGGAGNDQLRGEDGNDDLQGGDGADSLYGESGNDTLRGGTGTDTLMGGVGNDLIDGGSGNDLLLGADDSGSWNGSNYIRGLGNDTYLFGKGDGQDTIWDYDTTTGNFDTISLKEGVTPAEVRLTRPGNVDHLILSIAGTTDTLTVGNYFSGDATGGFAIEQIVFADGTTWDVEAIKARVLLSSEAADDISGFASADVINGAGGNDRIWARAGNDTIDAGTGNDQVWGEDGNDGIVGGDGNDSLYGQNGNDTLFGGTGADTLMGGLGDDRIDSGAGNDLMLGADDSGSWNGSNYYRGQGNDTYLFGKGDGQDTIWDVDTTTGNVDTISLKEGVLPSEVRLTRPGNGDHLVLSIAGTTDTLTVGNYFSGDATAGFAIEQIVFADGTTWDVEAIKARALLSSEAADDITGFASADVINGAGGNDRIWGRAGNDAIDAGTGNDQVWGEDGNDSVLGGDGNDSLYGQNGNDTLSGGTGADTLMGGLGNDTIDSGTGNDLLLGADDSGSWNGSNYYRGQGNDTYLFGKGDGQDTIWDVDTTTGNIDTISLKEGVTPAEVRLTRPGNSDHLVLSILGTSDSITVGNYFAGDAVGGFAIEQIVFADGTTWDVEAIKSRALLPSEGADDISGFATADVINGAGGNDRIWGRAGNDTIDAGTGNDQVWGEDGNDSVLGGDGNDSLYGQNGNDTLFGGTGADTLMGGIGNDVIDSGAGNDLLLGADDSGSWNGSNYYRGQGNDTYLFGKGDGQDTIWDVDTTTGNIDTISLKEGVTPAEVRLTRPGNSDHLVLSILGTSDSITVGNYFAGDAVGGFAIEQIVFADGTTWDVEAIKSRALLPSEGADDISGFATADVINGAGGNDRIWARAGNDSIDAGTGNDQVWGEDGNDSVLGGDGNDSLYGQNGNDTLFGGTGADTLMGGVGNDLIDGGTGNDLLLGADDSGSWNGSNYYRGLGNDTYLFGKGDGQDTIWDVDTTTGNIDTISLKESVLPSEVRLTRPGNGDHLVLSIAGTTDTLTVGNYFAGDAVGGFAIEQIVFADGTTWDVEAIKARALLSSEAADDISGFATADVINGAGGNDRIWARAGNDTIDAGTGNDQVWGEDGNDSVLGGDGNDSLYGQNGNDTLFGGTGTDTLMGGVGNDLIDGGTGNDLLLGADDSGSWNGSNYYRGLGNDTYLFGKGDGQDTIWDVDTTAGNLDTISLKEGVAPEEVRLSRPGNGSHLVLSIAGTTDSVTVGNFFAGDGAGGFGIEQVVFADGTTWDLETIKARSLLSTEAADDISGYATADVINGAGGDDRIWGRAGNDVIDGGAGNDQLRGEDGDDDLRGADGNDALYGENGNDTLGGGIGADTLFGGVGNDVIEGGAGNDLLVGADDSGSWNGTNYYRGLGNDTYRFGRGDGQDTLWDVDGTAGNTDKLVFGADVAFDQLWFQREGNDLAVSIIGTSERVAVKNWYAGNQFHVEQFVAGEGKVLLDTNVQALVNAMASFAPPAAGQTTLPQAYQDQLAPTLAANWVG